MKTSPIAKWALYLGGAAAFGSLLQAMSRGGSIVFSISLALFTGLTAAALGAAIGGVIHLLKRKKKEFGSDSN